MIVDRAFALQHTEMFEPRYYRHVIGTAKVFEVSDGGVITARANYALYEAPASTSFQAMFNAMLNDPAGPPTVIANSWAYCEDQTTLADVSGPRAAPTAARWSRQCASGASAGAATSCPASLGTRVNRSAAPQVWFSDSGGMC